MDNEVTYNAVESLDSPEANLILTMFQKAYMEVGEYEDLQTLHEMSKSQIHSGSVYIDLRTEAFPTKEMQDKMQEFLGKGGVVLINVMLLSAPQGIVRYWLGLA